MGCLAYNGTGRVGSEGFQISRVGTGYPDSTLPVKSAAIFSGACFEAGDTGDCRFVFDTQRETANSAIGSVCGKIRG